MISINKEKEKQCQPVMVDNFYDSLLNFKIISEIELESILKDWNLYPIKSNQKTLEALQDILFIYTGCESLEEYLESEKQYE